MSGTIIKFKRIMKALRNPLVHSLRLRQTFALISAFSLLTCVNAQSPARKFDGAFTLNGREFTQHKQYNMDSGYIEQYADREGGLCESKLIFPGTQLMSETTLGVCLLLGLFYLFVGIFMLTEVLLNAVARITARTEQISEHEGKHLYIEEPLWSTNIVNITLLSVASSSPQLFLCWISTFAVMDGTPDKLGPMVIVGSAGFNLVVASAVSVLAATKVKKILNLCAFLTTAGFATLAYIWLFIVLQVLSPGKIDFAEAVLTLLGYPALIMFVWLSDKLTENTFEPKQSKMRRLAKISLMQMAEEHGIEYVLDLERVISPPINTNEQERIKEYFKLCLGTDDLSTASMNDLAEVLEPDVTIERLALRKEKLAETSKGFVTIHQATSASSAHPSTSPHPAVGFKHPTYSISPSGDSELEVTVVKKVREDKSFWVVTREGSALEGEDYEQFCQLQTMKAREVERKIRLPIFEGKGQVQEKREFSLQLMDEQRKASLHGCDSTATITLLEDDSENFVGFSQQLYKATARQSKVTVTVKRFEGAPNEINVTLSTLTKRNLFHKRLDIETIAKPGKDFKSVKGEQIWFDKYQTEAQIEIELPNMPQPGAKVSFVVELSNAQVVEQLPDDLEKTNVSLVNEFQAQTVKLSKRCQCVVELGGESIVEQVASNEKKALMRAFMQQKDQSWNKQFKNALVFGPTIDEYDNINEKSTTEAVGHIISYPWKCLFAVIPPTRFYYGWVTFACGIIMMFFLSLLTYSVVSTAACVLQMRTTVLALTILSLGTSMPDIWCSMVAAKKGQTADAALLNITASNATNVFLGLGLPWTIMCIYRWSQDEMPYSLGKLETAEITFVIVTFMMCSILTLIILLMRRLIYGGEIGGTHSSRSISAGLLLSIWLVFVFLAALHSVGSIGPYQVFEPEVGVIKALQLNDLPGRADAPVTLSEQDHVSVSWWLPVTGHDGIDKCMVKFRMPNGRYRQLKKYCDCSERSVFEEAKCLIPHYFLHNDYGFEACSEVRVKIRYHNVNGWSDWSPDNTEPAKVHGCPGSPSFSTSHITPHQVTLLWREPSSACSSTPHYSLELKKHRGPFKDLITEASQFTATTYTASQLECDTRYSFRGRARNPVCASKYSDNIEIKTDMCNDLTPTSNPQQKKYRKNLQMSAAFKKQGTELIVDEMDFELPTERTNLIGFEGRSDDEDPFGDGALFPDENGLSGERMAPVITSFEGDCEVRLTWQPIDQGGFTQVQGSQLVRMQVSSPGGDWFDLPGCPDPLDLQQKSTTCDVPMAIFGKHPFSLDPEDIILARGRAENTMGRDKWSAPGPLLTAARFREGPARKPALYMKGHSDSIVSLTWASSDVNNDRNVQYELQQSDSAPDAGYKTIMKVTGREDYEVENIDFSHWHYYFRVRATDSCGNGPWSDPYLIVPADLQKQQIFSSDVKPIDDGWPKIEDFVEGEKDRFADKSVMPTFNNEHLQASKIPSVLFKEEIFPFSQSRQTLVEKNMQKAIIGRRPAGVTNLQTDVNNCRLSIKWNMPVDIGALDVHATDVEIANYRGEFHDIACTSQNMWASGSSKVCTISVAVLTKAPFVLSDGDGIMLRVRVKGERQWGVWTENSQSYVVLGPGQVLNLRETGTTNKQISLKWDEVPSSDGPLDYLVYWDRGQPQGDFTLIDANLRVTTTGITIKIPRRSNYRFIVRAHNDCGNGKRSEVLTIRVSVSLPKQMAPVMTESISGCRIKISWKAPEDNGGSEIISYDLQVVGRDQQFHPIDQLCGQSMGSQRSCTVTTQQLASEPYNLRLGDSVEVTAAAETIQGPGPASLISSQQVKLRAAPPSMLMPPEKTFYTANSVTIGWEESFKVHDPTNFYELYVDNGGHNHPMLLIKTRLTKYTYMIVTPGEHKFYVRAANSCGMGAYSPSLKLSLSISQVPHQMKAVAVVPENCGVRISWEPPVDGGSPIYLYILKARGSDGTYHPLSQYCGNGPTQRECTVEMTTLVEAPFDLETGDLIAVTAQAVNALGMGQEVSPLGESNQARMVDFSPEIQGLTLKRDNKKLRLSWDNAFGPVADQQTENNFYYEVLWDNQGNPEMYGQAEPDETLLQSCNDCHTSHNKVPMQVDGKIRVSVNELYLTSEEEASRTRFQVRAVTPCSTGRFSKVLHEHRRYTQDTKGPPLEMQTLSVSAYLCKVNIEWTEPQNGGSPITAYELRVRDHSGYFRKLNCQEAKQLTCQVSMKYLAEEPFNLGEREPIIVTGQAVNQEGKGPRSAHNEAKNGPWMGKRPAQVLNLASVVNKDQITLSWDDILPVDKRRYYYVEWDKGTGNGQFTRKSERTQPSITMYNFKPGVYQFRVHAHTLCGRGLSSDIVSVSYAIEEQRFDSSESDASMNFVAINHGAQEMDKHVHLTGGKQKTEEFPSKLIIEEQEAIVLPIDMDPIVPDMEHIDISPPPAIQPISEMVELKPTTIEQLPHNSEDQSSILDIDSEPFPIDADPIIPIFEEETTDPVIPLFTEPVVPVFEEETITCDGCTPLDNDPVIPEFDPIVPVGPEPGQAEKPAKMDPVLTEIDNCRVQITWSEPASGGSEITRYRLFVQGSDKKWNRLSCTPGSELTTCVVSMKQLQVSPHFLVENDPIIVRASAQNAVGNGEWSDPVVSKARMVAVPPTVEMPFEEKRGADSLTIGWEAAFQGESNSMQVYELFVDSGLGRGYTDVFYTTKTYFKVKNLNTSGIYKFKLRTRTSCDHGPYSPELTVDFEGESGVCATPIAVEVSRVSCSVMIKWTKPKENILGFDVEVKGVDPPDYLPLKDLCQRSESGTSCEVRMSSLATGLIGLKENQQIEVRVRPYGEECKGQWAIPSDNIKIGMLQVPTMGQLKGGSWSKSGITFSWDNVLDKTAGGDSYYEIQTDKGATGKNWAFVNQVMPPQNFFEFSQAERRTDYHFRVKAYNSCGASEFSEPLFVGQTRFPDEMEKITAVRKNCNIEFKWRAPFQGESRLIDYKIQVQAANGQFVTIPSCSRQLSARKCKISICDLARPEIGLLEGQSIVTRGYARNSYGESKLPSSVYDTGVVMIPCEKPTKVTNPFGQFVNNYTIKLAWDQVSYKTKYEILRLDKPTKKWIQLKRQTTDNTFLYSIKKSSNRGQFYQFRIRARSFCGNAGPPSNVVTLMLAAKPGQMRTVEVRRDEERCGVVVEWQPPSSDGGRQIISYDVQVRVPSRMGESEQFVSYIHCGIDPREHQCYIPMDSLTQPPYSLVEDQLIVARVAAINIEGQGEFSNFEIIQERGVTIETAPGPIIGMMKTTVLDSPKELKIDWQPSGADSPIQQYKLFWNQGIKDANLDWYTNINDQSSTYTISDLNPKKQYRFAVLAHNVCGTSPYPPSEESILTVNARDEPKKMQPLKVDLISDDSCNVKFSWQRPPPEQEVNGYKIFVEGNDGSGYPVPDQVCEYELGNTQCLVSRQRLTQKPFALSEGDPIIATIVAKNPYGESVHSDADRDSALHLIGLPPKPRKPWLDNAEPDAKTNDGKKIILKWDDVSNEEEITYQLWYVTEQNPDLFVPIRETKETFVELSLATPGVYWFKLRSKNKCDWGSFSDILSFSVSKKPDPVENVHVAQNDDCNLAVKWDAPFDGGSALLGYKVELETMGGETPFMSTNIGCGLDPKVTECAIDIQVLVKAPFKYVSRDEIKVRVFAFNDVGQGKPSEETTLLTAFKSVPRQIDMPKASKIPTGDQMKPKVRVRWEPRVMGQGEEVKSYDLVWDRGEGGIPDKRRVETIATFHTLNELTPPNSYQFRVRARNVCGYGEFSKIVTKSLREPPARMEAVRVSQSQEGCGVRFSWLPPESFGLPIKEYVLRIKKPRSDEYVVLKECKQNAMDPTFCVVEMFALEAAPYMLKKDDQIIVQALARTEDDDGVMENELYSPDNKDVLKLASRPKQISELHRVSHTQNTLDLDWVPAGDGGRRITAYNLFWDGGLGGPVNQQLLYNYPRFNKFNVKGLSPGQNYKFKIRARNACGFSKWSPILKAHTAFCPAVPDAPVIALKNKDVTIEWKEPKIDIKRGDVPIKGYTLELQKRNGDFLTIKECSPEKLIVYEQTCQKTVKAKALAKGTTPVVAVDKATEKPARRARRRRARVPRRQQAGRRNNRRRPRRRTTRRTARRTKKPTPATTPPATTSNLAKTTRCPAGTKAVKTVKYVKTSCRVPMLSVKEYTKLQINDLIQARVRAENKYCQGSFSKVNLVGQVIQQCPSQMRPVFVKNNQTEILENQVTVHWQTLKHQAAGGAGVLIKNFELRWSKVGEARDPKIKPHKLRLTSHTITGLQNNAQYVFSIRAENKFCVGPWSKGTTIHTGIVPRTPLPPTTKIEEHEGEKHVQIRWKVPKTAKDMDVIKYEVFMRTADGSFVQSQEHCNFDVKRDEIITEAPDARSREQYVHCHVPMDNFWQGKFKLDLGAPILAKVRALNVINWSEMSEQTKRREHANVEERPGQVKKFTVTRKKDQVKNRVHLQWAPMKKDETGRSKIESFILQFRELNPLGTASEEWKEKEISARSTQKTLSLGKKGKNGDIEFRIKARNRWGDGPTWSEISKLPVVKKPEIINTPKMYIGTERGKLKVVFTDPETHGIALKQINMRIRNGKGEWQRSNDCNVNKLKKRKYYDTKTKKIKEKNLRYCEIKMQKLEDDFQLKFDEMVHLQVAGETFAGKGPWSEENKDGSKMRGRPLRMEKPTYKHIASDEDTHVIQVMWKALTSRRKTGNSLILEYALYRQGELEPIYRGSNTKTMQFDLRQGEEYRFYVTASNVYGPSIPSPDCIYKTGTTPAKMSEITGHNHKDFDIDIMWEKPDSNGSPITGYEIQIWNKMTREFVEDLDVCDGSRPKVRDELKCLLSSQQAQDRFGYEPGDIFRAIVRAKNKWGPGNWSLPNQADNNEEYSNAYVFKLEQVRSNN